MNLIRSTKEVDYFTQLMYEAAGIGQEIENLKAEQEHILKLKKHMIDKGWMKRE